MIEVSLFGIALRLIPITLSRLFVTALYNTNVVISWTFD